MQKKSLFLLVIIYGAICLSATATILPDRTVAAGHYETGSLLSRKGLYSEAISEYKKALEKKPDHVDALFDMGTAYMNQKDYELAAAQFKKILVLRPGNKMAAGYAEYCERMEMQNGRKAQGIDNRR